MKRIKMFVQRWTGNRLAVAMVFVLLMSVAGLVVAHDNDGLTYYEYNQGVKLGRSSTQSINSGIWTAISFNTEAFDWPTETADVGWHNPTNPTRITPRALPADPYVNKRIIDLACSVSFASNTTGIREVSIRKNGTSYLAVTSMNPVASNSRLTVTVHDPVSNTGTDYYECMVYQSSGAALNVLSDSFTPIFSAVSEMFGPGPIPTPQ